MCDVIGVKEYGANVVEEVLGMHTVVIPRKNIEPKGKEKKKEHHAPFANTAPPGGRHRELPLSLPLSIALLCTALFYYSIYCKNDIYGRLTIRSNL